LVDGKPWVRAEGVQVFMPMQGERVVSVITAGTGTPNRTQFLHVDGKKVPGTDCANISEVHFSPDGKRYAADCETPARSHALLFDTKRGQEYQQIAYYGFSPDSAKVIYVGTSNLKNFLVVDDKESDGYNNLGQSTDGGKTAPVTYGNGGKRIGFVTGADDAGQVCYVWVDNKVTPMKLPGCASNFSFSPDASRYAFTSGTNFRAVYVDGAPLPGSINMDGFNFNNHLSGKVMRVPYVWSPDSKHVVYWGTAEDKPGMFVDGKVTTLPLPNAFFPTFSADGRHFIFGAPGPMQGSPTAYLFIYVDGRIAARFSGGAGQLIRDDYAWEMGPDGTFTVLVQDESDIKRVRITPGDDTSIDTMLAQSRTVK
jgi:dipeptidyl aminopeptidase/acylaminoacyl peptidase